MSISIRGVTYRSRQYAALADGGRHVRDGVGTLGTCAERRLSNARRFLALAMAHSPWPASLACREPKKANLSEHGNEYDYPPHRKERTKLRLEQPLVLLETPIPWSSTKPPKNRQVVPGPVGFGAQGVEIGFECSLIDPSATGGRDVLRVAARTL